MSKKSIVFDREDMAVILSIKDGRVDEAMLRRYMNKSVLDTVHKGNSLVQGWCREGDVSQFVEEDGFLGLNLVPEVVELDLSVGEWGYLMRCIERSLILGDSVCVQLRRTLIHIYDKLQIGPREVAKVKAKGGKE